MSIIQIIRIALKFGIELWNQRQQAKKEGRAGELVEGAQKLERSLDNADSADELAETVSNYFDGGGSDSPDDG